jgi:gliding motility-associated lipoprotein GldD
MQKRFFTFIISLSFLLVFLFSCKKEEQAYIPKPKGFNRIDLPEQLYQKLTEDRPYAFEYSTSAKILPDTFALAGKDWIYIYYPQFKANIQLTYKQVENNQTLLKNYINDAFKLTGKHQVRASSIQEQKYMTRNNLTAMIFKIEGDVPSPYQFYTTDSTKHFLRGAIYFSTATKNDSLMPVINFIQKDMIHLLNTLEWKR